MPHKGAYGKPDEEACAKAEDMRRVVDVPAFRPQHGKEAHTCRQGEQEALHAAQVRPHHDVGTEQADDAEHGRGKAKAGCFSAQFPQK